MTNTNYASARTLCEAFNITAAATPQVVALRSADRGTSITWGEYAARVRRLAAGLAALGIGPGDTVALMLANRPEFHIVDTAVLHTGGIPFSIYNTNPAEKIAEQLANAGNTVVICEAQFVEPVLAARSMGGKVEHVVCVDSAPAGTVALADVEAGADPEFDFEKAWRAVGPDSIATIIYTSGTTGASKGVELTHANVLAVENTLGSLIDTGPHDEVISYLPDAHVANRIMCHWANMVSGARIVTVNDLRSLPEALKAVRPTAFLGVPHTWYKLKGAVETAVAEQSALRRSLALWAIDSGRAVARRRSDGLPLPFALRMSHAIAERLVLRKLRAKLGMDRVRVAATGSAPFASDTHEYLLGLGLTIVEVWGLSESTGVATISPPDAIRIGSIGKPLPGGEIRVAADGELLIRGSMIMARYRGNPEQTTEAIDTDGWLRTGDIGAVDADGYYRIIDRKKDLIISTGGKNMSPANIEGAVRNACPLVAQVVVIGDDRPYVTALITLDQATTSSFAARHGLEEESLPVLAAHPVVREMVDAGVAGANAKLARVEQIKKYVILSDLWEPGGDLITPTLKLKRKPIAERYASEIDGMYS